MQPHSSSTEPTPSRIRWLKSELSRDQLHGKKVFAKFTTNQGRSFSGTGTIRALCNPEGLLSIDLVFTHILSPTEIEDIIFHISSRQLQHLTPTAASEDFDYHYEGLLKPDNTPTPKLVGPSRILRAGEPKNRASFLLITDWKEMPLGRFQRQ